MTTKYISNKELGRFNLFYRPTDYPGIPDYYFLDSLPHLDEIFGHPDVFYTFVFIKYPRSNVGHWCLLIKLDDTNFEWFDCLGKPVPDMLAVRLEEYANDHGIIVDLHGCKKAFMAEDNWICGKWCMFRVMTLPNSLEEFAAKIEQIRDVMEPDELVDFTVNFKI